MGGAYLSIQLNLKLVFRKKREIYLVVGYLIVE